MIWDFELCREKHLVERETFTLKILLQTRRSFFWEIICLNSNWYELLLTSVKGKVSACWSSTWMIRLDVYDIVIDKKRLHFLTNIQDQQFRVYWFFFSHLKNLIIFFFSQVAACHQHWINVWKKGPKVKKRKETKIEKWKCKQKIINRIFSSPTPECCCLNAVPKIFSNKLMHSSIRIDDFLLSRQQWGDV